VPEKLSMPYVLASYQLEGCYQVVKDFSYYGLLYDSFHDYILTTL